MTLEDRRAGIEWVDEKGEIVAETDDDMYAAMMLVKKSMEGLGH